MATNQFTHTVGRVEFIPDIAKVGDLVVYLRYKNFCSKKKIKCYGIVSRIERSTLWVYGRSNLTDEYPMELGLIAEHSEILAIYPNGEVFKHGD